MLDIRTNKLAEQDLKEAIIDGSKEKRERIMGLLQSIAESANWDINVILSDSIQLIKGAKDGLSPGDTRKLRNSFRKILIAKRYGIGLNWNDGDYYVGRATDDCVIIQSNESNTSIVLSPSGELIIDEGKVKLLDSSLAPNGYNAFAKIGGSGLFSKNGREILPCIFSNVDNKIDGRLYAEYKNVRFVCLVKGDSEDLSLVSEYNPCFAFDGGIVIFSYPELQKKIVCLTDQNLDHRDLMRAKRKAENQYIKNVSEELYAIMDSTHHRLSKEEILQLKNSSNS